MLKILSIITLLVLLANETSCNENVSAITLQLRDEIANALNEENKTGGMEELHCIIVES